MAKSRKQTQEQEVTLDFLGNWQAPEGQESEIPLPYVQWLNGMGAAFKKVSPLLAGGGWELPLEVWGGVLGDSYQVLDIPHGIGKDVLDPGYILPLLHIAVINTRFTWERLRNGKTEYVRQYEEGCRGRLNVYCLVKELGDEPVMLTLRGMVTKHFGAAKRQHLTTVVKAANKLSRTRYPQYLFWIPLQAGNPVEAGEGDTVSKITPPVAAWNIDAFTGGDAEAAVLELQNLYIGDELRDLIAGQLYQEGVDWARQYDRLEVDNATLNGNPWAAEFTEDGHLVIPDLAEAGQKAWLRWAESALELETGEAGGMLSQVLRRNRHAIGEQGRFDAWAGWVEKECNRANGIVSEEVMIEQMVRA